jgi:hypothetical protein
MEVVMKTKMNFLTMLVATIILGACSSSMQVSKTSRYQGDDLYYNPSVSYSVNNSNAESANKSAGTSLRFAELEKKYSEILANDTTGSIDTVIYKADSWENPYDRLLSDSYRDSYERRLRGASNPYYGINNWSVQYSQDFWYASAYDPAFYNIIIMGTDIWVEPNYISAMFGSYRSGYYYRYGYRGYWDYGYNYYGGSWYSPLHRWYMPGGNYYGYGYGYNFGYGYGYDYGYWSGYYGNNNNYSNNSNVNYGRRPGGENLTYGGRPIGGVVDDNNISQRRREIADSQVTLENEAVPGRRPRNNETLTNDGNGRLDREISTSTRPVRQDPTTNIQTTRPIRKEGENVEVREPNRDGNTISRPSRESLNVNPTRIATKNEPQGNSSSREHNPSYTRPNAGNSNEFNRPTRNYPTNETGRTNIDRGNQQVTPPTRSATRQPDRSYNPPPRVSSPSSTSPSHNSGSSGSISRPTPSSSGSNVSSPSRSSSSDNSSSSGSSSSSSSRSSSSSSSSNSSNETRTRNR